MRRRAAFPSVPAFEMEAEMTTVESKELARVFVEVADTLVDDFDLVEFLQMLTIRTSELVGAQAAGLLLSDERGVLQFMAASDERTELLELYQVQAQEGPCQDCYRAGVPVVNADLGAAADRWPLFAPRAVAAGFQSVHAFPLRLRGDVIGALTLFSTAPGRMDTPDLAVVQALADVATIGLLQERTIRRSEVLSEQLQGALNSRVVIEQAKGVVAQLYNRSVDDAFELLRTYSRRHRLRLGEVARQAVTAPKDLPDLTG